MFHDARDSAGSTTEALDDSEYHRTGSHVTSEEMETPFVQPATDASDAHTARRHSTVQMEVAVEWWSQRRDLTDEWRG